MKPHSSKRLQTLRRLAVPFQRGNLSRVVLIVLVLLVFVAALLVLRSSAAPPQFANRPTPAGVPLAAGQSRPMAEAVPPGYAQPNYTQPGYAQPGYAQQGPLADPSGVAYYGAPPAYAADPGYGAAAGYGAVTDYGVASAGMTTPAAPYTIRALDTVQTGPHAAWCAATPMPWQPFAQGEYAGHYRLAHVPEYRLRVDDQIEFLFRLTRIEQPNPYELNVGDEIRVESFIDPTLNRDLIIQPDGTITLRLLGQAHAARRTVEQLRREIEESYSAYYKSPSITVTPLKVNTKLEDLRATFDNRAGMTGGQSRQARVTPEGSIALPAVGVVQVQGLTLNELKHELNARYNAVVEGLEVQPVLLARAPRYVYVLGEVRTPGRYTLEGPTTVMQAVSMAGGWNVGANLRQIVIFRRGDDWRLLATLLDLRGAMLGKVPAPADELWLNDSDIVIVPKSQARVIDDAIQMIFTDGIYRVVPITHSFSYGFQSIMQ